MILVSKDLKKLENVAVGKLDFLDCVNVAFTQVWAALMPSAIRTLAIIGPDFLVGHAIP